MMTAAFGKSAHAAGLGPHRRAAHELSAAPWLQYKSIGSTSRDQRVLRAESPERSSALRFLLQARDLAAALRPEESQVSILDPAPSPMERRAGRFRAQLLIQGRQRDALQHFLDQWLPQIAEMPQARKTRWSLDVDPMDLY